MQKQLALMLGRQQIFLDLEDEGINDWDALSDLISNSHLNTNFIALAREVRFIAFQQLIGSYHNDLFSSSWT